MTGLSVAQGHINGKILEVLEANDIKLSRRRKKTNCFAHNFLSIKEKNQLVGDLIQEDHTGKEESLSITRIKSDFWL